MIMAIKSGPSSIKSSRFARPTFLDFPVCPDFAEFYFDENGYKVYLYGHRYKPRAFNMCSDHPIIINTEQ